MDTNIFVGNLPWSVDDDELRELFSKHGNVTRAQVITEKDSNRSRGFGFVEMDPQGAQEAIQALDKSDLHGRTINVNEAKQRRDDRRDRNGGGRRRRRD